MIGTSLKEKINTGPRNEIKRYTWVAIKYSVIESKWRYIEKLISDSVVENTHILIKNK